MILFEQFVVFAVVGFVFWQVVIPLVLGVPVLPLFRRSNLHLMAGLQDARQTLSDDDLRRELRGLLREHLKNEPAPAVPVAEEPVVAEVSSEKESTKQ